MYRTMIALALLPAAALAQPEHREHLDRYRAHREAALAAAHEAQEHAEAYREAALAVAHEAQEHAEAHREAALAVAQEVAVRPRVMVAFSGGSFLGVNAMNLTDGLKEFYGSGPDHGVLIAEVTEDSPAETAGVRVGDVITRVGEHHIRSTGDLRRAIRNLDSGDQAEIGLVRERAPLTVSATIAERGGGQWFSHGDAQEFHIDIDPDELRENVLESMENLDFSGLQMGFANLRERMDGEWGDELEERLAELEDRLRELESRMRERPE